MRGHVAVALPLTVVAWKASKLLGGIVEADQPVPRYTAWVWTLGTMAPP